MNVSSRRALAGLVAVALLLGFVALYGHAIVQCWRLPKCSDMGLPAPFVYVSTALAGLIGGVVAMAFNENLPVSPESAASAARNDGVVESETGRAAAMRAASATLQPDTRDTLDALVAAYAIVYFLVGFAAVVTWVAIENVHDLVKNLALIVFGLFLAISRTLLRIPSAGRN